MSAACGNVKGLAQHWRQWRQPTLAPLEVLLLAWMVTVASLLRLAETGISVGQGVGARIRRALGPDVDVASVQQVGNKSGKTIEDAGGRVSRENRRAAGGGARVLSFLSGAAFPAARTSRRSLLSRGSIEFLP